MEDCGDGISDMRIANADEFDKIFSIMKESFPVDEYRTYEEQKALLDNPKYAIHVVPDAESENVKAFITVWQFANFAFVEHFAVNSVYRNQGLGSQMLHEIFEMVSCRLCLEVELPETDFAKRRIGFYKRNGFFENDYPYIQPAFSEDKNPVPLIMMTSRGRVSEECFEKMKEIIYTEVYKVGGGKPKLRETKQ